MKSHEAARITTGERIIARTREELRRPEVMRALGVYAERTIAILDSMYVPHVVGGHVIVPPELRDSDKIPLVLTRSVRRLIYPTEVTPTQMRVVEQIKADGWRGVANGELTDVEARCIDKEYAYEDAVKLWPTRRLYPVPRRGKRAFGVTHPSVSSYDFQADDESIARVVDVAGKPLVTLDPGRMYQSSPTDTNATLVHELQHVDDVLQRPVAVYGVAEAAQWNDDSSLRFELRGYAMEATYMRALYGLGYSHPIERIRARHNGPLLLSDDPFRPSREIKEAIARQDLSGTYH